MRPGADTRTPRLPPAVGAAGPVNSGPGVVSAKSKLLSPVLGILVATPKPVAMDIALGRIPALSPKAGCVLMVVTNRESGNPDCAVLTLGGWAAGEVRTLSCAGATGFPNRK